MEKTCCAGEPCHYRLTGGGTGGFGCNYPGYCDFQLPRDSRMQPLFPFISPYERCTCGASGVCPIHGMNTNGR